MPFKLSTGLSPSPSVIEIADFWEVECLKKADFSVSILDLMKILGISEDVQESEAEEAEINLESFFQDVVSEIQRRSSSCLGKYPYSLDDHQYVLSISRDIHEHFIWIYHYLLLATRNNMGANRIVREIDGSQIFEKLCKDVLMNYLGEYSDGILFGTADAEGFYEKLKALNRKLRECDIHPINTEITYNPMDDKLDIVVWIPFADNQPSKIICFGQCKTGTHWLHTITQLKASDFLKKWFSRHPVLDPINTYLIADIVEPSDFYYRSVNNLFFDRCRIINYSKEIQEGNLWYQELTEWTKGIMEQYHLSSRLTI